MRVIKAIAKCIQRIVDTENEVRVFGTETDGYHVLHKGRTYTIGPDDVNKYIWDFRRLYPLINAAFDSSAWHLSQVGFRNHDAIMVYNDLEMPKMSSTTL
jgi:hypothetical protein